MTDCQIHARSYSVQQDEGGDEWIRVDTTVPPIGLGPGDVMQWGFVGCDEPMRSSLYGRWQDNPCAINWRITAEASCCDAG